MSSQNPIRMEGTGAAYSRYEKTVTEPSSVDYSRGMRCKVHPSEELTNFCCIKHCLTPICPECIDNHNKDHKAKGEFPEVDTFKRVINMCLKQVSTASNTVEEELKRINKFSKLDVEEIVEDAAKEIQIAQQNLHKAIDTFFEEILAEYEANIRKSFSQSFDLRPLQKELQLAREELESLDAQLRSGREKYTADSVRRVIAIDMSRFVVFYQEKVRQGLGKGMILPFDVVFTQNDQPEFHNFLKRYLVQKARMIGVSDKDLERTALHHRQLKLQNDEAANYFERKMVAPKSDR
jgi:hypothetical protein